MRLIDRAAFLKLPAGTFYFKGARWDFEGLAIKGDTLEGGHDWYYQELPVIKTNDDDDAVGRDWFTELVLPIYESMLANGVSVPLDLEFYGRDGLYDADALFLVCERSDLLALRAAIDQALGI